MPALLNPEKSVRDACLHLFRYLYDYEELRRNPIFRERFSTVCDRGTRSGRELLAFSSLQTAIAAAVEKCRHSGSFGQRRGSFTQRHYAIMVEHTFNQRPAKDVARQLGLSIRQFYRDRGRAYMRVLAVLMKG